MSDRQQLNQSELIALLGQLKNKRAQYPADLQTARRAAFVAQVQAINLPSHGGQQGGQGHGGQGGSTGSQFMGAPVHAVETVLQYVLAGLVAVMAGTAAYVYQDEIRDFINPPTPSVEMMIDTAVPTPTPVNTATEIPSDTPTPTIAVSTPQPSIEVEQSDPTPTLPAPTQPAPTQPAPTQPAPTQPPPTQPPPTATNPGLHLGNTKTPKPDK